MDETEKSVIHAFDTGYSKAKETLTQVFDLLDQIRDKRKMRVVFICHVKEDRKVFFVHGGTEVVDREEVRLITEEEDNAVIVASYGTFSTGINIKRLHNIIFASPSKSRIRNLQSIGRVLRKGEGKSIATLYDIADDIGGQNYTLRHLNERVTIYNEENFKYEVIKINLKAS